VRVSPRSKYFIITWKVGTYVIQLPLTGAEAKYSRLPHWW